MRLNFNVLWVEDQPALVEPQAKAIAAHMEEQGFELQPIYCTSLGEVRQRVADDVFKDDVDLILVDWDLGGGIHGQNVISEIRDSIHYKDVIFYSAMSSAEVLRKLAATSDLEGVYCVTRPELVNEVVGVFESLVKKVLDLDHARGIVMGATSDIDFMVEEALKHVHERLDDEGRKRMMAKGLAQIEEKMTDLTRRVAKLRKAPTLASLLKAQAIVTAYDRLRLLSHALAEPAMREKKSFVPSVKKYMKEVVPHRNILGHQILQVDGRPVGVVNNRGRQITVEEARTLRCLLLRLRRDFRELLVALQS